MSSADYWRKREAEALKENQKQEKDYDKQVAEIYQQMIDECDVDIKTFYARYASKEGITMAEAKKRADKLDIEEYGRKAKKYVKDKDFSDQANEEMRLYNMTMKVNRLELLKAELGLEMTAGSDELQKKLGVMLDDRVRESYKRQAGILGKTVPDADTYGRMMDTIVNGSFHNATWSQRIWANQEALRSRVNALLVRGLIGGRNPREMARDLTRTVQSSQSNAERLMRTELARVQIGAQQQAIADAGYDEYTFLAIGTACGDCRALDEKTFKLKKMMPGENAPPMHPNCRCSVCAAMSDEEFKELTGVDPVKMNLDAINAAAVEAYKVEAENKNKSVELPEELRSTKAIDESIKNGIRDAIDGIEKNYGYQIPELEYAPYTENEKAPFTFIPYQKNGMYKAKLNINTLFDWNESLESFNERIYNKNYKMGVLASKNLDDLILHETAHFKTFESCKTWGDFLLREREVREKYIPGISKYNTFSYDGAETIAEGLVAIKNNEDVPNKIKDLVEEYIKW